MILGSHILRKLQIMHKNKRKKSTAKSGSKRCYRKGAPRKTMAERGHMSTCPPLSTYPISSPPAQPASATVSCQAFQMISKIPGALEILEI
jgi:hypothetical protein